MESSTTTPASALSSIIPANTSHHRSLYLYPIDPNWHKTVKHGLLWFGGAGFLNGWIYGIWKDTYWTSTGMTNMYNVLVSSSAFFLFRELAVSPLLVQLRLTEDHRRRYLVNRAASPKHHLPTDPPLPPEQWSHIRYRRLLDTGIAGGTTALAVPRLYRHMLIQAGYQETLRLAPKISAQTFGFFFAVSSAVQFAWNSYLIHDIRLHQAYDAFGPMPDVDIRRVRAVEQEDLKRVALYAVVRDAEERKRTGQDRQVEERWEDKELAWYTWERFRRDAMPRWNNTSGQDRLKEMKGKKRKMENELEMVKEELEAMGEIFQLVIADDTGIIDD